MSRARERIKKAIRERGFEPHFIEYVRGSNVEMVGDTSGWVVSVEECPEVFVGRTVDDVIKDICGGLPSKEAVSMSEGRVFDYDTKKTKSMLPDAPPPSSSRKLTANERIQAITEAWKHDMKHPYCTGLTNDRNGNKATYIDEHSEVRSLEEVKDNPFYVASPKSDVADLGFLLQQLEQGDKTIAELRSDIARHSESTVLIAKDASALRQQNDLMLSVLQAVSDWFDRFTASYDLDELPDVAKRVHNVAGVHHSRVCEKDGDQR